MDLRHATVKGYSSPAPVRVCLYSLMSVQARDRAVIRFVEITAPSQALMQGGTMSKPRVLSGAAMIF